MADAEPDVLTNAFLASHPEDAARVLERLSDVDAAALFERTPGRLGGPVLAAMLPYAAARCLVRCEVSRAAMLLSGVSFAAAAAVLRHLPEARRAAVLEAMPTAVSLACSALLGYPEDSVGTLVETEIVTLSPDGRAQDALEALRTARSAPCGPIYVVDARRRPLGRIELAVLMRAAPTDRLDTLMRPVPATLPAVTPLAGAGAHPVWRETDIAPVVERGGELVGVLERRALGDAEQRRVRSRSLTAPSFPLLAGVGYWQVVSSLAEASIAALASSTRRSS